MAARNPFLAPEVKSRRGGPVKQPLSRDVIVRAALELLSKESLEQVSLRKVAAALETGPASLYAYVEDLQELYVLALDRALGDVVTQLDPKLAWRPRLKAVLESYYGVLSRSPGVAQLALTLVPLGPNALRIWDALLGILADAGMSPKTSAWAVDVFTLYVTGIAAEHSHRRKLSQQQVGSITAIIAGISAADYPHVHAVREELTAGTGQTRSAWALDVLINGVLQTPREPDLPVQKSAPAPARKKVTRAR